MKKVILTGATGFIGQQAIEPMLKQGVEVYALFNNEIFKTSKNANWIKANLFNSNDICKIFADIKPEYLLHFAWDTRPGIYLNDNSNFEWLNASMHMLKQFKENGGKRAVYAGTCFEYKFSDEKLNEYNSELSPVSVYGKCKKHLNSLATLYAEKNEISFGWGRIFYVYGPNEHEKRLTTYIINSLRNNQQIIIKSGKLIKDYIYTKDIAGAFVHLLGSNVEGAVNICSGKPITIKEFADTIAKKVGREDLLVFQDDLSSQEPPIIIGDDKRLCEEVGYELKYNLDEGVSEILNLNE